MISTEARPRLAPRARLRFDRKTGRYLLLYPERGLALNATGSDILRLCTGEHSVADIIDRLAAAYAEQPREAVAEEVQAFLAAMADRGLVLDTR